MGREKDDGISFIVCCDKFGWTKSFWISRKSLDLAAVVAGVAVLAIVASFYLSYSFYQKTETLRAEKEAEVSELMAIVEGMSQDIIIDNKLEERFIEKVAGIEKKLASLEKVLSRKKSPKKRAMGGRGLGVGDITPDYFRAVEKDMDRLSFALSNTPLGRPASGSLSSSYGYRKSPFSPATREFHGGVDFRGDVGDDVVATADGTVELAGWVKGYGKRVVIRHKTGYKTLYAHLSKITVKKGQKVSWGETIGEIGSTGRSTGPHLHYEIIKYGKRINPRRYVFPG